MNKPLSILLAALVLLTATLPAAAAPKGDALQPHAWESARDGILSYTDLVLCYGGSTHRKPYEWTAGRFAPMVSYTDPEGTEHWLFDSFLCIEFQMGPYSINLGQHLDSGTRKQWEELLDYWLGDPATGVGALETAVAAAAERLGVPAEKRKVVMVMPDPIIYEYYSNMDSPTIYWGRGERPRDGFLEGRRPHHGLQVVYRPGAPPLRQGRLPVHRAGGLLHRLGGPRDAGRRLESGAQALGGGDPLGGGVPACAQPFAGVDSCNRAAGYTRWREMGIDYAYMQPNIFWGRHADYTWERFFSDVKANNLAMELEFDDELLAKNPGCEAYRTRLREYMSGARTNGIYGTQPLAYYQGQDTFYNLSTSSSAADRAIFDELCRFVLNNPLRKQ